MIITLWNGNVSPLQAFIKGINQFSGCPHKGPVMRSFDHFIVVSWNKFLTKLSGCRWFETPGYPYDITVMIWSNNWIFLHATRDIGSNKMNPSLRIKSFLTMGHMDLARQCEIGSAARIWHYNKNHFSCPYGQYGAFSHYCPFMSGNPSATDGFPLRKAT